ncbi:hypothetical protein NGF19_12160 [Streptomyces sp. RY43-2]|uniref:Uncharacterized protein n=1 Tax=Streptomyces macrolidinus TaxID=2952607 RepID=A0ABT0ZD85_9ACTN|nr:hypothetical protein [Streptomyces macrolidinus]MCN9241535.1 hypothetical protein [Streptomyces macrolidinus]
MMLDLTSRESATSSLTFSYRVTYQAVAPIGSRTLACGHSSHRRHAPSWRGTVRRR